MKVVERDTTCPFCEEVLPLATQAWGEGDTPSDGDISICFDCGTPGIFDSKAKGGVRKPTAREARELAATPDLQHMLRAWRQTRGGTQ